MNFIQESVLKFAEQELENAKVKMAWDRCLPREGLRLKNTEMSRKQQNKIVYE
jgi:hypothetical protein